MLELRKALHPFLKRLHNQIYFQERPITATVPFAVYTISTINDDGEATETVFLDIDGWTNEASTANLENMMKELNKLNKAVLATDKLSVVFYLDNKIAFVEEDTGYHRRRYSYSGKLFRR